MIAMSNFQTDTTLCDMLFNNTFMFSDFLEI